MITHRVLAVVLRITMGVGVAMTGASCAAHLSTNAQDALTASQASRLMLDGMSWLTANLDVNTVGSFCYSDVEANCVRYGRLYTWSSAQEGCQSLGNGWRLPTNDEWRQMAKQYGGVYDDSDDRGKGAFEALLVGGGSGFNALLGGGRAPADHEYARLEAHGFYWTASETDATSAWFYNFGRGGQSLYRHNDGEKERALSVRCVRP